MFVVSHRVLHVRLVNQPLVTVVALCQKGWPLLLQTLEDEGTVPYRNIGKGLQIQGVMSHLLLEVFQYQ